MEANKWVKIWLIIGLIMLIIQVMVGGITRLTGSGLSITEWDIVTGTLPPLSEEKWEAEFDLYKETPQYQEINEGMEMGSVYVSGTFKFIYFWEWVHRFWARIMGLVFVFPLIFFMIKGWIQRPLLKKLTVVFFLAALAASFGWIMVASGLVERPWVNAYKLAIHLCIAFAVYGYLWWTYLGTLFHNNPPKLTAEQYKLKWIYKPFVVLLMIQIFVGGVMSGMKAGVVYPTWPDMNGEIIPSVVFNTDAYSVENFNYYDRNELLPALVQVIHRTCAYALILVGFIYFFRAFKMRVSEHLRYGNLLLISLLVSQIVLGIITIINCKGSIPVGWGVAHQMMALFLLTAALYVLYILSVGKNRLV